MRILITGAGGFVGTHLRARLAHRGSAEVLATGRGAREHGIVPLDVREEAAVDAAIAGFQPSAVVHLAAIAAVGEASRDPRKAWAVNVDGTLNVARALLRHTPQCTLILASSAQIYGDTARSDRALDEAHPLAPVNDYAATKAAADLAIGALAASQGLRAVRFRPFNHTGPGQSASYVVPAFARQIARIEAGLQPPVIEVGNLDAERDLLDVRDVVDAYALVMEGAASLEPGIALNLATGRPRRIGDLLGMLVAASRVPLRIEVDPARLRTGDPARLVGDAGLARRRLGWAPAHDIAETLAATLEHWRGQVRGAPSGPDDGGHRPR